MHRKEWSMWDRILRSVGLCLDSWRKQDQSWRMESDERREHIEKARHEDLERMGRLELECRHLQSRWKTQGFCFFNKQVLASAGLVALFFSRARELGYHEPSAKEFCRFLDSVRNSCNGGAFYIPCVSRDLSINDNQQICNMTATNVCIFSQNLSDGAKFFFTRQEQSMLRGSLNIEIIDLSNMEY